MTWTNIVPGASYLWSSLDHNGFNTLRPRRNRRHFADDIFRCIFLNEYERISLRFSLKFVPKVRINNIPSLVQIMAWRRPGDKPLSEPMMVSLLTHICVILGLNELIVVYVIFYKCVWIWQKNRVTVSSGVKNSQPHCQLDQGSSKYTSTKLPIFCRHFQAFKNQWFPG